MDRVKSGLHNFVKDKKKGLIIGTAVAVVGLGFGAGLLFNHGNSGGTESNGALNNPTVVSNSEKKEVPRTEVPISSIGDFDVYTPNKTPDGFDDTSTVTQDKTDGSSHIEGQDGAYLVFENAMDTSNEAPYCTVELGVKKYDSYAYDSTSKWLGDNVQDIADNVRISQSMVYKDFMNNPPIVEKVTDTKIKSRDGSKLYTLPTIKAASPNNGLVIYFGAEKLKSGNYAVFKMRCEDMHGVDGYSASNPIPQSDIDKAWKVLDTLEIKEK